jgi:phage-related protein
MKQKATKKKRFRMMQAVKDFMREQSGDVKQELNNIVWRLETEGALVMPYGEKISGDDLFAIRVIQAGNIRVFYVYGIADYIFGIHAYTKKTQAIPGKELNYARKVMRSLQQEGVIK